MGFKLTIIALIWGLTTMTAACTGSASGTEPAPQPTGTTIAEPAPAETAADEPEQASADEQAEEDSIADVTAPAPTATVTPTAPAEPTATTTPVSTPTPLPATSTSTPTSTLTPALTPTPEPEPVIVVDQTGATNINVRAGPGTNYPILGQLQAGDTASVTGRNAEDSWWQISLTSSATGQELTPGWVFGGIVSFNGNGEAVAVAEAPPPPTATPVPVAAETAPDTATSAPAEETQAQAEESPPTTPQELTDQLRCGKDFCITYQAMVPIWENGGCIGNHSIYVTVLEGPPPGRPMDGVVVGDTFGNIEVASGDKGPGFAEVTLWMNSMSLKVKRHIDGTPYTSEESFSFTAHDELIPAEVLAANGYCEGRIEKCREAQQNNQVCRGHYSWKVTFHKFD